MPFVTLPIGLDTAVVSAEHNAQGLTTIGPDGLTLTSGGGKADALA